MCSWDLDNIQWSGEALQNSISNGLWRQIERDLDDHATGTEVFKAILMKYRHLNSSTIRKMEQELPKLKIINELGQDVNSFSRKIANLAGHIEGGADSPPSDLSLTVCNTFLSSTADLFKHRVIEIHNIVEKGPSSMHWEDVLQVLKDKYDSLTFNEIYYAASDRKQDKDNELAAMTATVRHLEVKIDKLQGNNKD